MPTRSVTARTHASRPTASTPIAVTRPVAVAAPTAAPLPRLHITKRGRRAVLVAIALPLIVGASMLTANMGSATASIQVSNSSFEYVQVKSGQSLWQLAESIAPEADPRDVVADVVHLNGLASADVHPGQRLALPAAYAD
ncbi:LysM peptidoglycan-binding domain-containing protein [Marisediminicola senii]|uniref:LysM peptidoglycan-binding domain-containing protein n=1 Tax=Marisediminicola senii TaxID=2711233 RepID=UPI0013ED71E1|nr:LysM peptidoglycan-binding domain-containing protein [Marisediminicola senii]